MRYRIKRGNIYTSADNKVCHRHLDGIKAKYRKEIKMKATQITITGKTNMARAAADYIYNLAMANGFTTAFTKDELSQYESWFEGQISECDSYIAENLVIETEEIELDDEE